VTQLEKDLLNAVQRDFPLDTRPFELLGRRFGISEEECIGVLRGLVEQGVLREIRPVVSWNRAGFTGVLLGLVVDPKLVDAVADAINTIPGVTHNYLREGSRNLWCTLTCESGEEMERHLSFMRSLEGVSDVRTFASEKTYKIGLMLDV